MNKNIKNRVAARSNKLSDSQRNMIFDAFDAAAKVISKKTHYIRRFSEPRKNGLGYRCKFWGISLKNTDATKLIAKLNKMLPDGYTVELSRGLWTWDIIIRTPKFTVQESNTCVDPDLDITTTYTETVDVEFKPAEDCPNLIAHCTVQVVVDTDGDVISSKCVDLTLSCPLIEGSASDPDSSEALLMTIKVMDDLNGETRRKDALVEAGKKAREIAVVRYDFRTESANTTNTESIEELKQLLKQKDEKIDDLTDKLQRSIANTDDAIDLLTKYASNRFI